MEKISANMPKTVKAWLTKNESVFIDAHYGDGYDTDSGKAYDILLSRGFCDGDYGCHTIIEPTVKAVLSRLRSISKCDCMDCLTGNGW